MISAFAFSPPEQLYHCQPLAEPDKSAVSCDLHQYSLLQFHADFYYLNQFTQDTSDATAFMVNLLNGQALSCQSLEYRVWFFRDNKLC